MLGTRRAFLAALVAAAALVSAAAAEAKSCEGVTLPDRVTVDDKALLLNGMGVREATFLNINVYVAGLYVENKSSDGERIASAEESKRMHLVFVRDVSQSDMSDAIQEGFRKVAGSGLAKLQPRIDKFRQLLPTFKKGDHLRLTYRPGKGLEVAAGARTGTIEGADFTRALFLIWLGAHPPNDGLKRGLLGGACG